MKLFSQHTRSDTVRKQLLRKLMMTYLERLMTMLVPFLFFWTFQRRAFDTVDSQILLTRPKCRYGLEGNALAWMRCYLSNRFQFVRVANDCSSKHRLASSVPQGSVFGPLLYSMYMALIADVIKRLGTGYHFYADDSYFPFVNKRCHVQRSMP